MAAAVELLKVVPASELIWASPRELYNIFEARSRRLSHHHCNAGRAEEALTRWLRSRRLFSGHGQDVLQRRRLRWIQALKPLDVLKGAPICAQLWDRDIHIRILPVTGRITPSRVIIQPLAESAMPELTVKVFPDAVAETFSNVILPHASNGKSFPPVLFALFFLRPRGLRPGWRAFFALISWRLSDKTTI